MYLQHAHAQLHVFTVLYIRLQGRICTGSALHSDLDPGDSLTADP